MKITAKLFSTAAFVLLLSTSAFSQEAPTKDTIIVRVNGVSITLGHVLSLSSRLPEQYTNVENDALYKGIIEQLVQQELLKGLIKQETDELKLALDNEKRSLFAEEAIRRLYDSALTEDAIKAKYKELYSNLDPVSEYNASHILVETEAEALVLVKLLEEGGNFADLAKEKSTGPSGASGGNLGWAGLGQFVPAFETAMIGLEAGQVSDPVKTQFGWHVIKLDAKRNKPAPDLEMVRTEVEDAIREVTLNERLATLEASGGVIYAEQKIDPSIVKNFELLKN